MKERLLLLLPALVALVIYELSTKYALGLWLWLLRLKPGEQLHIPLILVLLINLLMLVVTGAVFNMDTTWDKKKVWIVNVLFIITLFPFQMTLFSTHVGIPHITDAILFIYWFVLIRLNRARGKYLDDADNNLLETGGTMKKIIIVAAVVISVYVFLKYHPVHIGNFSSADFVSAPDIYHRTIVYTDIDGNSKRLGVAGKPAIVGFWIKNCGYSEHALHLLSQVRNQYSESKLDVVGFYMNSISSEELSHIIAEHAYGLDYGFTIAAAQPPVALIAALAKTFQFNAPGRTLYIIGKNGHIRSVDISDIKEKNALVLAKLNNAIKFASAD